MQKQPQRTATARAVDAVINNSMSVDISGDDKTIESSTERWEDLDKLVSEIGHLMLTMIDSVDQLTNQPEVMASLKENKGEFESQRVSFFNDVKMFTERITEVQKLHANKTGRMTSIAELVEFSAISTQYYNMTSELQILLAPSVTSMFLLLNDAVQSEQQTAESQQTVGA